jgi:hypothetical protein
MNLGRIQTRSKDNCRVQKLEEVLPVEHDGFVDGVRHEPLRGLRDVLPKLVVRTVLLLQQAFVDNMRKGFVPTQSGGSCHGEMCRTQRTSNRINCYVSDADSLNPDPYPTSVLRTCQSRSVFLRKKEINLHSLLSDIPSTVLHLIHN